MMSLGGSLHTAIHAAVNSPRTLVEIYAAAGTLRYSDQALTWNGESYSARVIDRGEVQATMTEIDSVRIRLDNIDRALDAYPSATLRGRRLIVRLIDASVADDSVVLFHGVIRAAGARNERERSIEAVTLLGGYDQEIPGRLVHLECGWPFRGEECGYAGAQTQCDRSWARCSALANTNRFGGIRFTPHQGVFSYSTTEMKRFLLFFVRRKKTQQTATFAAVDDSAQGLPLPIALGRVHLAGMPIQHADEGGVLKAIAAFCVGPIESLDYLRANDALVVDWTGHIGQYGGTGAQTVDSRFPGGYPYNLIAYAGLTIPSDVAAVDNAPTVSAVVMGSLVKSWDSGGTFISLAWSDNPVWNTQHVMGLRLPQGGMGIDEQWFDVVHHAAEAAYCDALVSDASGDQKIYTPEEVASPGEDYRRYQSTGVDGVEVDADGPYADFVPTDNDTQTPTTVQTKRFTLNIALTRSERAVDVILRRLLPCYRGYVRYSQAGKIQICVERADRWTTLASGAAAGASSITVASGSAVAGGDLLIVSAGVAATAECVTVGAVAGASVTLANSTVRAHANGARVYRVAARLDSSIRTAPVEWVEDSAEVNRVIVNFVDAPSGFQARALHVNDYDAQEATRRIEPETIEAQGVDSYRQAYAIGAWELAKRSTLATRLRAVADIRATLIEIGDVVAMDDDGVGVHAVVVTRVSRRADYEVEIEGRLYDPAAYVDTAPRATAPVPSLVAPPPIDESFGTGLEYWEVA